jgi:hypothetical protein
MPAQGRADSERTMCVRTVRERECDCECKYVLKENGKGNRCWVLAILGLESIRDADLFVVKTELALRGCVKPITPLLSIRPLVGLVLMPSPHSTHDVDRASIAGPELLRMDRSLVLLEGLGLACKRVQRLRSDQSHRSHQSHQLRQSAGLGGWLVVAPRPLPRGDQYFRYLVPDQTISLILNRIGDIRPHLLRRHLSQRHHGVSSSPVGPVGSSTQGQWAWAQGGWAQWGQK